MDRRGHRQPARGLHPGRGRPRRDHRALAPRTGTDRGGRRDGRAHGAGQPSPAGPVLPGPADGPGRTLRRPELVHLRTAPGHRRVVPGDGIRARTAPGRGRGLHHGRGREPGAGPRRGPPPRRPHRRGGDGRPGRRPAPGGPGEGLRPRRAATDPADRGAAARRPRRPAAQLPPAAVGRLVAGDRPAGPLRRLRGPPSRARPSTPGPPRRASRTTPGPSPPRTRPCRNASGRGTWPGCPGRPCSPDRRPPSPTTCRAHWCTR